MAFEEKIENTLHIITGDKENYYPMFVNPSKELNFNTEGFDFVGLEGTFVAREQPQGNQYPLELYFDNKQPTTQIKRFELSARNKGMWILEHPYYGRIVCQPLSLKFDTYVDGMTKVTGTVWETIEKEYPVEKKNIEGSVYEEKGYIYQRSAYTVLPDIQSIEKATALNQFLSDNYSKLNQTLEQAEELKSRVRSVTGAINDMIELPLTYVAALQSLIEFPLIVSDNITLKINQLKRTLDEFIAIFDRNMFEGIASSMLYAAFEISINGKYYKRNEISRVVKLITDMRDAINNKYEEETLELDYDMAFRLDLLYNIVIGNLYKIALEKEQERSMILEKDSTVISLAHKLYGLSEEAIDRFVNENNLSINELLVVKKGREIIWFV